MDHFKPFKTVSLAVFVAALMSVGYYYKSVSMTPGSGDYAISSPPNVTPQLVTNEMIRAKIKDYQKSCEVLNNWNINWNISKIEFKNGYANFEGSCDACSMQGTKVSVFAQTTEKSIMDILQTENVDCSKLNSFSIKEIVSEKPKKDQKEELASALTDEDVADETAAEDFEGNIAKDSILYKEAKACDTKASDTEKYKCFKAVYSKYSSKAKKKSGKGQASEDELKYIADTFLKTHIETMLAEVENESDLSKATRELDYLVEKSKKIDSSYAKEIQKDFSEPIKEAMTSYIEDRISDSEDEDEYVENLKEVKDMMSDNKDYLTTEDKTALRKDIAEKVRDTYQDYLKGSSDDFFERAREFQAQNKEHASDGYVTPWETQVANQALSGLYNNFNVSMNDATQSLGLIKSMDLMNTSSLNDYFQSKYRNPLLRAMTAAQVDPYGNVYSLSDIESSAFFSNNASVFNNNGLLGNNNGLNNGFNNGLNNNGLVLNNGLNNNGLILNNGLNNNNGLILNNGLNSTTSRFSLANNGNNVTRLPDGRLVANNNNTLGNYGLQSNLLANRSGNIQTPSNAQSLIRSFR